MLGFLKIMLFFKLNFLVFSFLLPLDNLRTGTLHLLYLKADLGVYLLQSISFIDTFSSISCSLKSTFSSNYWYLGNINGDDLSELS